LFQLVVTTVLFQLDDFGLPFSDECHHVRHLLATEHDVVDLTTRVPHRRNSWKEDPNERARRIWLWWRIRVHEVKEYFFFNTALRLVALVQPSSCSLERDFSQFKLIVDSCGQMLQDTLESRMYERCNNGENGLPLC
jgi:hypothetical protein